ncbi:MAG: histidine kinase N-terminal 7TM domain-containing protein [Bacteroidales bacterium]
MSNYTYTIFSLFFLASSFVSFFVAYLAWQKRRERGAKELVLVMLSSGFYAFAIIFETASSTLDLKIFWSKVAYLGAVTVPLFYAFFVFRFVGKDKLLTKKNIVILSIVPLVVFILTLTNEYHHLIWEGYSSISPTTNLMEYYHGAGFWIGNVGYNYFLFALSSVYLFKFIMTHIIAFKLQVKIIFVASLCPWIASVFYVTAQNIVPGFDLVPLSMIITGMLLTIAIFNKNFLDLVPVARETLLESLKEGILVLDFDNRIQDINRSAKNYLGITNNNVIGLDFKTLKLRIELFRTIVLNKESKQILEVKENDVVKHYSVENHKIANYPGSRLVVLRDYSQDVKREQELISALEKAKESDKMKSSFLANLSHEIRTPLNIITGFLDVIHTSEMSKTEKEQYIELLKENSDRILNTLNDIVEISKIESDQVSLEESQTNLNEIMDYLYNSYLKIASNKNIALICVKGLNSRDSLIFLDRLKLISVLSNLIKNALKFTTSGKIEFGYFLENDKITFYVEDTGIGILKERQIMIFNRFVQAEQSMNRSYEGAGLGLSIVKAYVGMMGGEILLTSEPGKGSRFYFSISYKPVIFSANL